MGGFNEGTKGGSKDHRTSKRTSKIADSFKEAAKNVGKFVSGGGFTGAIVRGLSKKFKDTPKSTFASGDSGPGEDKKKEGIELAKASTTSATILGPGEIQKEAANTIKGPTTLEMSASETALANKRKGRASTNITAKKTLAKNYTLSKKSLLG